MSRTKLTRSAGWLLLAAMATLVGAEATEAQSLSSRLQRLARSKQQVQSQIREIRQEQRSATERLHTAQVRLEALQGRLSDARRQLNTTRRELEHTRAEVARLEKSLAQTQADVEAHLVALYRAGESSYLGVLLQSESFSDFSNRQSFIKAVVNQDQYILDRLARLQAQTEQQRDRLARQEQQRAALVRQIAEDEAEARQRHGEVKTILREANSKRVAAESALAQMEREESQVRALIRAQSRGTSARYSGTWSGSLLRPAPGRISSPFGMRRHPITGRYKLHTGVDIAAPSGTPIKAADDGLVISAGWMPAYGRTVVIDHGSGIHTWYAHCSATLVSSGQTVRRGQTIARVGSTGMSTGPHLHFSVLRNGNFVNPLGF